MKGTYTLGSLLVVVLLGVATALIVSAMSKTEEPPADSLLEQISQQRTSRPSTQGAPDARHRTPARSTAYTRADDHRVMVGAKAFVFEGSYEPPSGPPLEVVQSLRALAERGDADAALDIYMKLAECKKVLNLGSSRAALTPSRSISAYDQAAVADISEDCHFIARQPDIWDKKWLEMAADGGSIYAQLLYVADPGASIGGEQNMLRDPEAVHRYKQKAMRFLEQAAGAGSIDAMLALSDAYDAGVLVEKNASLAYAYYLAAHRASPTSTALSYLDGLKRRAHQQGGGEANALAESIYKKCCAE